MDIPYVGIPSGSFSKRLILLTKIVRPEAHVQRIPRPPPAIGSYFSSKDPIPKKLHSGVVYQINCLNCSASYIEKNYNTSRETTQRTWSSTIRFYKNKIIFNNLFFFFIKEEKNNIKEENDNILNNNISVLKKHEFETGHRIN